MEFFSLMGAAAGTLAFFAGIALLMWVNQRGEERQRELEHTERIKALECGQPLPDAEVAWAKATSSRAWAAGLVGFLVPLFVTIAAIVLSIYALWRLGSSEFALTSLVIGWGICGIVTLVAVTRSLNVIRQLGSVPGERARPAAGQRPADAAAEAIREKPLNI